MVSFFRNARQAFPIGKSDIERFEGYKIFNLNVSRYIYSKISDSTSSNSLIFP